MVKLPDIVSYFLSESKTQVHQHRSTVLTPLIWMVVVLSPMVIALAYSQASYALAVVMGVLLVAVVVFLGCYLWLFVKDRQALRSEDFVFAKEMMDRGLIGDSKEGLTKPEAIEAEFKAVEAQPAIEQEQTAPQDQPPDENK